MSATSRDRLLAHPEAPGRDLHAAATAGRALLARVGQRRPITLRRAVYREDLVTWGALTAVRVLRAASLAAMWTPVRLNSRRVLSIASAGAWTSGAPPHHRASPGSTGTELVRPSPDDCLTLACSATWAPPSTPRAAVNAWGSRTACCTLTQGLHFGPQKAASRRRSRRSRRG